MERRVCLRPRRSFTELKLTTALCLLAMLAFCKTSFGTTPTTRGLKRWSKLQVFQEGYSLTRPGPFVVDSKAPTKRNSFSCVTFSHRKPVPGFAQPEESFQMGTCLSLTQNVSIITKQLAPSFILGATACAAGQQCIPVETEVDDTVTPLGVFVYIQVKRCDCVAGRYEQANSAEKEQQNRSCHVANSHQKFFARTRFERTVNVGVCSGGNCNGNNSCVPIQFRTKAIPGPNGRVRVDVISKCGCAGSCYRAVFRKAFSVSHGNKKWPQQKTIDVGQCVNSFRAKPPTPCRYMSDDKNTQNELRHVGKCDQSFNQNQSCEVTHTKVHHLKLANGKTRAIREIVSCGFKDA